MTSKARKVIEEAYGKHYSLIPCQRCGFIRASMLVHHKDGNPKNNALENLEVLCFKCHRYRHTGVATRQTWEVTTNNFDEWKEWYEKVNK